MGDLYKCFGWCWGEIGCLINDRLWDTKKVIIFYFTSVNLNDRVSI